MCLGEAFAFCLGLGFGREIREKRRRDSRELHVSPVTRTHLKQVPRSVRRVWLCHDDVT